MQELAIISSGDNPLLGGAASAIASSTGRRVHAVLGVLIIAVSTVVWFATLRGILVGDDVGLIDAAHHGHFARTIPEALSMTSAEKYRPVLIVVLSLIIPAFGANFGAYQAFSIGVEIANAVLVAAIVMRLTRGRQVLALACSLAFVMSRFAYFNVMQVGGIMEGLALLFMLLAIRDAADAFVLDRHGRLVRSVLWYALAAFTDERFLVVGLFIVACAVLHKAARARPWITAGAGGGAIAVLAANIGIKKLLFHQHIMVGTGGAPVSLTSHSFLPFTGAAIANVLGFNVGPDYLSGADVARTGLTGYVLGSLVAVPALALFAAYAVSQLRRNRDDVLRAASIALALFVPLLLTTAATVRQEFRWLYAPDALFLIGVAAVAARLEQRRTAAGAAIVTFAASIGGAVWYRGFADNVFFMGSMRIASGVRDAMLRDPDDPVYIVDHGDANIRDWVFFHGAFFRVYGFGRPPVTYVRDAAQVRDTSPDILSVQWPNVVHVMVPAARTVPVTPFGQSVLSFTKAFPSGTINDKRAVATPNGHGALVLEWPATDREVVALTVVDSFRYRYPPTRIKPGMVLAFYVGRPLGGGDPTRAFVTVTDGAKSTPIFDERLPLPGENGIKWQRRVIDLHRFAGRSVTFTFGADADGDPTGAWAAFGFPALIDTRRS